jgi:hypothetical protein
MQLSEHCTVAKLTLKLHKAKNYLMLNRLLNAKSLT